MQLDPKDLYIAFQGCVPYLAAAAISIVAAIVLQIAAHWKPKPLRKLIRSLAFVGQFALVVVLISAMVWNPLGNAVRLVTRKGGTVDDATTQQALSVGEDIAAEGTVLLQNDEEILPLKGRKLNVFGWASTSPVYGGAGSGSLRDGYDKVSLLEGLANAGIETNSELTDFYTDYCAERPKQATSSGIVGDWTLPEPPAASYSDTLLSDAKSFSDTALIVISRVGGEGLDLPRDMSQVTYTDNSDEHADFADGEDYLELSQTERDMIGLVCQNFQNVVVLYNGANTMPLGWTKDYPQIKATLWLAGAGQSGFNALGHVLTGDVNSSGKTADTFVYDLASTPWYSNFGNYTYTNADDLATDSGKVPTFVNYDEGIYVGYRYYETAADEGTIDYDATVQYPFGYSLSYTTFSETMGDLDCGADGTVSVEVSVTNTGGTAGKTAVELYCNPPYTNGGIEKSSANLIAFAKSKLLEPGESQTITLSFAEDDLSSYDSMADDGTGCYVLEAGSYRIQLKSDSHTLIDERILDVSLTQNFDDTNARTSDRFAATNEFSDAAGTVTYLSRKDHFANFAEATAAPAKFEMMDEQKAAFIDTERYEAAGAAESDAAIPATGASNGVMLSDLRGKSYDDPLWEKLLDELTPSDMQDMIGTDGYATTACQKVGKVMTSDVDGPSARNDFFTKSGSVGMPPASVIACTWNPELAASYGSIMGKMATEIDVSGWYAPSINIHRSTLAGRNYEYYSEDGLLAGKMAARVVKAAADEGVYCYVKHFALNEQETNRWNRLCTWANEQSIREIYLRPFEIAVKEGGAHAIMSSYNYIGGTWAGGRKSLLTDVLRNEWGFTGFVLTDYDGNPEYMNADQMVRAGGDAMLTPINNTATKVKVLDATGISSMRRAVHDIMYTVVNSNAYAGNVESGMEGWQKAIIGVDVLAIAAMAGLGAVAWKKYRKRTLA